MEKSVRNTSVRSEKRSFAVSGIGVCLPAGGAHGDVKIASTVTVMTQTASIPQTVTTDFQGSNARTETAGGMVTLYDGAEEKVYTLDPTQKTYFVRPLKEVQKPPADSLGKKKEVLLDSRITLTSTTPQGRPESVTTPTEATAVPQSALPDSVFALPSGDTQVPPPPQ